MKQLAIADLEHVLGQTQTLWERARGRRIFISGGTGFFGVWLLETLLHCNRTLDLNLSATVLTRNPKAFVARMPHLFPSSCIHLLEGDVRRFAFPVQDVDYVIHAATPTTMHDSISSLEL